MKIMRSTAVSSTTYFNCHIETGERSKVSIGERILFDDGNVIVGPLKIVGEKTHRIIVTADDDYAVYKRIDADETELENLKSITPRNYVPVTNSIFLDGFLSAAYQDNSGIVRADIDQSMHGLKEYYANLLDENGIDYRATNDGFVFPDPSVIQAVFERQQSIMPPKYVIGFLSSFIVKSKVRVNRNPRYEKYTFILPATEEYYRDIAPNGLYFYLFHGRCVLFSIFGSFEPLARYIDSIESVTDEPLFADAIHIKDLFEEVAPELIFRSLALTGCKPHITETEGPVTYLRIAIKENNQSRSVTLAVCVGDAIPKIDCDYTIRFDGRKPRLYDNSVEGRKNHVVEDLFYHSAFRYSNELRDYLQIIFNKM